jgi:hypothetical protein
MTKGTIDYSKGSIYQIVNDVDDEVYVGSTCDKLTNRFHGHRGYMNTKKYENIRLYQHIREIGIEHFRIELIEYYPCNTKEQLHSREGHFIRERATLNKRIAGRTKKQFYETHKTEIAERQKQYYKDHKEEIAERRGRIFECPCGSKCRWSDKSKHFKTRKHLAYEANQQRTT